MSAAMEALLESAYAPAVLLVAQATMLLLFAAVVSFLLPRRAYAARHLVWALAVGMLVLLPVVRTVVPTVDVTVGTVPARIGPIMPGQDAANAVAVAGEDAVGAAPVNAGDAARLTTSTAGPQGLREAGRTALPAWPYMLWITGSVVALAWLLAGRLALGAVLRRAEPLRDAMHARLRGARTRRLHWCSGGAERGAARASAQRIRQRTPMSGTGQP